MSREDAREFVRKLLEAETLRERIEERLELSESDSGTVDSGELRDRLARVVPEFAEERGYDFTADEGFEALRAIGENQQSTELSDAELEGVAGGAKEQNHKKNALSLFTIAVACTVSMAQDMHQSNSCFTHDL